jgi:cytochrome d ubiquinol oxidase subunit II
MNLNILWFLLITVLFTGFFFLEGFDYGVGMLLPFLGKTDSERRLLIQTIGPFWDGNEVWLLTAGGALFAAFPNWYATLFSGFYLALMLMLVALIVRASEQTIAAIAMIPHNFSVLQFSTFLE